MKKVVILFWVLGCFLQRANGQAFIPYPESHNRLIQGIDFAPSGDTMYFTLPHAERVKYLKGDTNVSRLALYMAYLQDDDDWSEPQLLPFSGSFDDYEPNLSPDGSILFFNSNRPFKDDISELNNLWYVQKINGIWPNKAAFMPLLNQREKEESYASIDNQNTLFYLSEFEIGGSKGYGIYVSQFEASATPPGKKLFGDQERFFGDPCVNSSGDTLIMTSWTPGAWDSTCDIYISYKGNGTWSDPQPLKKINSPGPDFSPTLSPDSKHFYYRRNYGFEKILWRMEN